MDEKEINYEMVCNLEKIECFKDKVKTHSRVDALENKQKEVEEILKELKNISSQINKIHNLEGKIDTFLKTFSDFQNKNEENIEKMKIKQNNFEVEIAKINSSKATERIILASIVVPMYAVVGWIFKTLIEHGEHISKLIK